MNYFVTSERGYFFVQCIRVKPLLKLCQTPVQRGLRKAFDLYE